MAHLSVRIAAFCIALASTAALAHHSYVGDYDAKKVVTLKGVISDVRYANPHIFFTVDVAGKGSWKVETESIPKVQAKGLSEKLLKVGATVTVQGWPARDGSPALGLKAITLPGGKVIAVRNTPR